MGLNATQSEFEDLMSMAGFRPVDAARALALSKASVSKILAGKQTPRPHTMEIFRQKVAELSGRRGPGWRGNLSVEPRLAMKYPDSEDLGGATPLKEVYEDTKKKLEELKEDAAAIRAVHAFVEFSHAKRKRRK